MSKNMVNVREEPLVGWERIQTLVKRALKNTTGVDAENLVGKIWIELWLNGKDVSFLYVRNRCIDEIRHRVRRDTCSLDEINASTLVVEDLPSSEAEPPLETRDFLDKVMECPWLEGEGRPFVRRIIFHKFYLEMSNEAIGEMLGLSKGEVGRILNEGMAKLREWARVVFTGESNDVEDKGRD